MSNEFAPDGIRLPRVLVDAFRYRKPVFMPVARKGKLECAGYRAGRDKNGSAHLAAAPPPEPDIVRADSHRIEMIPAFRRVFSYHPADVEIWYGDARSCREGATWSQVSTVCQ